MPTGTGGEVLISADQAPDLEEKPLFTHAVLARREARVARSRIDAVNSRLETPVEQQALGEGGQAPVAGSGAITLADGTELAGDLETTHAIDPRTGAPFPLGPEGFLAGDDRLASGAVISNASIVRGRVEIGQGTIFVEGTPGPARITGTATTRGIAESGLVAGEGFQPQLDGTYAGGLVGEGSVLGVDRIEKTANDPPLELEKTPDQLRNEMRVLAASRGAATLEPGVDGEFGTDDDVFSPLHFEAPLEVTLPDPTAGGTDLRGARTAQIHQGTLKGSITLQSSGSPYFFRHIDLPRRVGDFLRPIPLRC